MKEHPNAEIVYIGITCGLSAPYVAGQLSYCMDQLEQNDHSRVLACALIGFNPIDVARRTQPINSRNETFADLLVRMSSLEQLRADSFFILNPLVGPEPVTGSSRMKSGTTTKMMLDIVLSLAVDASSCLSDQTTTVGEIVEMIDSYDRVANEIVYGESESIGEIIDRAAESLRASGSVNYLLDDERLGFLACVDASECVPTYGANKDDIKGKLAEWILIFNLLLLNKHDFKDLWQRTRVAIVCRVNWTGASCGADFCARVTRSSRETFSKTWRNSPRRRIYSS